MESSTEHSDNIFQIIDGIFTHYLGGCDSVVEIDEYTITISNVAYTDKGGDMKEKFLIVFEKIGESTRWSNRYKGILTMHQNGNVHAGRKSFYETTPNGSKRYNKIEHEEMEEVLTKLKREYNLDKIIGDD